MNKSYHNSLVFTRLAAALSVAAAVAMLSSCTHLTQLTDLMQRQSEPEAQAQPPAPAPTPPPPAPSTPVKPSPLYAWNGNGRWVSHIEVDVDQQKARFFDGEDEVGWTTIASGIRSYPTPTGRFAVLEKVNDKKSNLYGKIYGKGGNLVKANAKMGLDPIPAGGRFEGAKMPYFLRVTGDGIGLHAGPIPRPGSPASHGCIRMPSHLAPVLYQHVNIGTSVAIVGNGPSYATYLAQQQRTAAKNGIVQAQSAPARPPESRPSGAAAAPNEGPAATLVKVQSAGPGSAPATAADTPAVVQTAPIAAAHTAPAKAEATPAGTADTAPAAAQTKSVAGADTPPAATEAIAAAPAGSTPAPAKTAAVAPEPAAPAPPPATVEASPAAPAPATAKTLDAAPVSPAPAPASAPIQAPAAPAPAATVSTGGNAPAAPSPPEASPPAAAQSTPEKEG